MAKQEKKSSAMPLIIIGVVLIAAIGGFYALYSTSKPQTNTNRANASNSGTPRPTVNPANAPPGAALGINMIGSPTAPVTIEEFADFQCPTCASVHPAMKDIQSAFAGNKNVKFVFRHLPLSIHDKAFDAAGVVEAAGMQGKFWPMVDQLLTNQTQWANAGNYRELWRGYAERIGLDVAKWEADSNSMAAQSRIRLDMDRARGMGVQSTPTVYLNGRPVPLADLNVATMRPIIEAEIANATKPAAAPAAANSAGASNSRQ